MPAARVLGLFVTALVLTVAAASGQPPGVKFPPQVKPGMPPGGVPIPKPPVDKGKNPVPGVPPGGDPKTPGSDPKTPGTPGMPDKKRDLAKWPKEVNGKTVDDCVKEMRSNPDPAVRESAVRTLPMYGPVGRDKGAENLLYALAKDPDVNVKMTAMSVAPTVLLGFADSADQPLADGLTILMSNLTSESVHIRYEAVQAVTAVGPYMKTAKPDVIAKLAARTREASSYQLRRGAVAALASVGQGAPPATAGGKGLDPDPGAVSALLDVLRIDNCAMVRREAVNALIAMGPVAASQQKAWRTAMDNIFRVGAEKDKGILLWVRVLIVRNDPNGLKGNEAHLNAIAELLKAPEPAARLEGCRALDALGEDAKTKLQGLLDIIRDPKEEPLVVAAAIAAVAGIQSQAQIIIPVLQNTKMTHANMDVRKVAQEAEDTLRGKKN